jgi:hypothetical protein
VNVATIKIVPNVDESEVLALQHQFASRAPCSWQSETYVSNTGDLSLALVYEGELRFGPAFFSAAIKSVSQNQSGKTLRKFRFQKFLSPGCFGQKFDYWAGDPWSGDDKHLALVEVETKSSPRSKALILDTDGGKRTLKELEGILAHGMWSRNSQYYLYRDFRNWYHYNLSTKTSSVIFQGTSFPRHCYFIGKQGLILLLEDSYRIMSSDSLRILCQLPLEENEVKADRYSLYDPFHDRVLVGINPTFRRAGIHVRCEKWKAIAVDQSTEE